MPFDIRHLLPDFGSGNGRLVANQRHWAARFLGQSRAAGSHVLRCQEMAADRDNRQTFQEVLVFERSGFLEFFKILPKPPLSSPKYFCLLPSSQLSSQQLQLPCCYKRCDVRHTDQLKFSCITFIGRHLYLTSEPDDPILQQSSIKSNCRCYCYLHSAYYVQVRYPA